MLDQEDLQEHLEGVNYRLIFQNRDIVVHQSHLRPKAWVLLSDGYTFNLSCFEATKFRIHLLPHTEVMPCR